MSDILKMDTVIPLALRNMGLKRRYSAESVLLHWKKIVGEDIAAHAQANSVHNGTLLVGVNNSVWCHHLSMMKDSIMQKINEFTGEKLIYDIRFQAGFLKKFQNEREIETNPEDIPRYKINKVKLEEQELKFIQDTVSGVENKYLRNKLAQIIRKDTALQKIKQQSSWHTCKQCTVLCPPEEIYCSVCKSTIKQDVIREIIKNMREIPWIRYHEIKEHIPCSHEEYHQAKYTLVSAIGRAIQDGDHSKITVMTFMMLTTGAKIDGITDAAVNKTLDKFRRKK